MPLLRKGPFIKRKPPCDLDSDDDVFVVEATKEVFSDYDSFFKRTILCNSLVWSCALTGKSGLTYDEAKKLERKTKKRIGRLSKPLRNAILYCAVRTKRGRISELLEDVWKFVYPRIFINEVVEGTIDETKHLVKVLSVSQLGEKDSFSDSVYEVQVMNSNSQNPSIHRLPSSQLNREKGALTKEKNLLFLKQMLEHGKDGNLHIKESFIKKYQVDYIYFTDFFSGPEPVFEESVKKKKNGNQGTLDKWMNSTERKIKSSTELEAETERSRRMKDEMNKKMELVRHRKLVDKVKEKEKRKEEKKLLFEVLNDWKKLREDLSCDDHKSLPIPTPLSSSIPSHLFGNVIMLLEFFDCFDSVLESRDAFPSGISFEFLSKGLLSVNGSIHLFEILSLCLRVLFDLQREEDEEVKKDKNNRDNLMDKNLVGKEIASTIKSATEMYSWSFKHQGQSLADLHVSEWSLTEILRIHLEASGAFRGDRMSFWRYQQRGGYRYHDDSGLHLRLREPEIMEALKVSSVYELSIDDKLKILTTLMEQILSYATIRDEIDERFNNYQEAKAELRNHQINENKRIRLLKGEERVLPESSVDSSSSLTQRQRIALREKELRESLRKEECLRYESQKKENELVKDVAVCQAKLNVSLLGRDRCYRRYWILKSLPGIFVEDNDEFVGLCEGEPTPYNPESGPPDEATALLRVKEILTKRKGYASDKENTETKRLRKDSKSNLSSSSLAVTTTSSSSTATTTSSSSSSLVRKPNVLTAQNMGESPVSSTTFTSIKTSFKPNFVCLADSEKCPVHSKSLPRVQWSHFSTMEDIEKLIDSLNQRGFRESELRDKLILEKDVLAKNFKKMNSLSIKNEIEKEESQEIRFIMDSAIRDQILELEEKIFMGNLGSLKVKNRQKWISALSNQSYDCQTSHLLWGPHKLSLKLQCINDIRSLSYAILQVGQSIDEKYITGPLHENEKGKKKRLKEEEKRSKKEEEFSNHEPISTKEIPFTPFQSWEESLINSTSHAQLFIHLTTLDSSIVWSKSVMNTKCRVCRRKTDPEKMLLCDKCDRGHHMYCLKPKLKSIPNGDWYCQDCKPKERLLKNKSRRVFKDLEEEEEEEEEEDSASTSEELEGKVQTPLGKRKCATEASERISQEAFSNENSNRSVFRSRRSELPSLTSSSFHPLKRKRKIIAEFVPTLLEDLLNNLMKHRDGWPFDRPITKADAPDYHKIIKRPLDLGTIRTNLNRMKYNSNSEVIDDIQLVFTNCSNYNPENTEEYQCGLRLEQHFIQELEKIGLGHHTLSKSRKTL